MSARTDLVAQLPWVTRLERTQDCDAYRYSSMSSKAWRDPVLRAGYKCRSRARWQFRALPESRRNPFAATSGTYCWHHLFTQILHGPAEEYRFARTMAKLRKIAEPGAAATAAVAPGPQLSN